MYPYSMHYICIIMKLDIIIDSYLATVLVLHFYDDLFYCSASLVLMPAFSEIESINFNGPHVPGINVTAEDGYGIVS